MTSQDPSIPDVTAPLDARGRIVPQLPVGSPDAKPRYVVAASNLDIAGKRLAQAGLLALYRVRPPLGLATLTTGITADGWTGPSAAYTDYIAPSRGKRMVVTISRPPLSGPPPANVAVTVGRAGSLNGAPAITRIWTSSAARFRTGRRTTLSYLCATSHFASSSRSIRRSCRRPTASRIPGRSASRRRSSCADQHQGDCVWSGGSPGETSGLRARITKGCGLCETISRSVKPTWSSIATQHVWLKSQKTVGS